MSEKKPRPTLSARITKLERENQELRNKVTSVEHIVNNYKMQLAGVGTALQIIKHIEDDLIKSLRLDDLIEKLDPEQL